MKTIILYATKHGAACEIAQKLAKKTGGTAYDLKRQRIPPVEDYDCVIIGSSLYAGMARKECKAFTAQNVAILKNKRLGLYLSCLSTNESNFKGNFPEDLLSSARAKAILGGIFDPKKTNGFERFIIKLASKLTVYSNTINDDAIDSFIKRIYEN